LEDKDSISEFYQSHEFDIFPDHLQQDRVYDVHRLKRMYRKLDRLQIQTPSTTN